MRLFCLPELLCPPPRGHTLRSEYSIDAWDPGPQSPPSHSEIQQEELDCYLPVDFSVLLARRQQFVEEIRHKRFRPKKKKKKKGYVLGLPSWFFANADDNPLSAAVTKAGAPFLLSSFLFSTISSI
jgi:hypothetical protein